MDKRPQPKVAMNACPQRQKRKRPRVQCAGHGCDRPAETFCGNCQCGICAEHQDKCLSCTGMYCSACSLNHVMRCGRPAAAYHTTTMHDIDNPNCGEGGAPCGFCNKRAASGNLPSLEKKPCRKNTNMCKQARREALLRSGRVEWSSRSIIRPDETGTDTLSGKSTSRRL